jgi:hypothetical protein
VSVRRKKEEGTNEEGRRKKEEGKRKKAKGEENMCVKTLIAAAALVLWGNLASAQTVTYDVDRSADFSKMRTYTWVQGVTPLDELNHKRIVNAVNLQLSRKGLTPTPSRDEADVLVAYHVAFDRDVQINGFASGWGGYRFGAMRSGVARAEDILVGTLVVDVVDAKTGTIVWRGVARKDVDPKASPEKREKNIQRAAEKLFRNYPAAR